MSKASQKYRGTKQENQLVAFSLSFQRENLLARGLGIEHLRELLLGIARPLLRQGASLAYGGGWEEIEGNFTFDLLELIKAEQEDHSLKEPGAGLPIGSLYNHVAWPYYLGITAETEARWINCCRIIRVTQEDAGLRDHDVMEGVVSDPGAGADYDRFVVNRALTLSKMRRVMADGCDLSLPTIGHRAKVPGVAARIVIGGKVDGYAGMMPGIFEETQLALERRIPLYVLGGFGGGAELLSKGLLGDADPVPELSYAHHREHTPEVKTLSELCGSPGFDSAPRPAELFEEFGKVLQEARKGFPHSLNNGLSADDNRRLMTSSNINEVRGLVGRGLDSCFDLSELAY